MGFWPTGKALPSRKCVITIAGRDLSLIEREYLRQHITLMSQQGHIFDASIKDNLHLAKHDATQEEMHKALMLESMDKIIVMEQGKIVAQGQHSQLISNNDYYQKLLNYF